MLYHGVHGDDVDLGGRNRSGKHIARSRFNAEMRHLARTRPVVTMTEIARALRRETDIPDGAVAVTLDDGYLNNHEEAWPILENYGVPATIYLATGYIGTGRMMWSDRLEAAILGTKRTRLDIQVRNRRIVHDLSSETDRITAFLEIKALCKASPNDFKDEIIDVLTRYLDTSVAEEHPLYAFMAWDQVREMDASPLIDFGAHTVDHVSLARVPDDEMRNQINSSVEALERELGHRCRFFSYPEGQRDDFDERVIGHLLRKGFDHTPSAIEGVNELPCSDPFRLFRTMVGFEGRPYPFG